ncbi:uncharacterized protein LOC135953766 [Calliphora vicina]|uniref:uncharacterized protein LOC135953766 n=1 Tax=Calliphora vicina TaxID=7373 RepID=UPI00325B8A1B
MLKWVTSARGKNLPISGPLMKQKTKEFADALGHEDFEASTGWLDKFKKRHCIVAKTLCLESADANKTNFDEHIVTNGGEAIRNLSTVWNAFVKPETIANCFRKAGFSKDGVRTHWDEEDFLPLADLAALQASFREVTNVDASFEDYVNVDIDVQTMGILPDEDIIINVLETRGVSAMAESHNDEEEPAGEELADVNKTIPTLEHVSSSIDVLRTFVEMRSNVPTNVFKSFNVL